MHHPTRPASDSETPCIKWKCSRAGQPEQPRLAGAIGGQLEYGNSSAAYCTSSMIRAAEALHEQRRVCLGQVSTQRIVQGHVARSSRLRYLRRVVFPTCLAPVSNTTGNCLPRPWVTKGFERPSDLHAALPEKIRLLLHSTCITDVNPGCQA